MKKNGSPLDLTVYRSQEDSFVLNFSSLQSTYSTWKLQAKNEFDTLSARGKVFGKALPGRAVMLINSLEIDETKMPAIFEQPTSPKVGNYVPSTKIEILSDVELLSHDPKVIIVWSWHIIKEIEEYLDSLGYRGEIWVPLPEFRMYRAAL